MEPKKYLTPKKFLLCCGLESRKCTEAMIGAYLGEQFLNLQIYNEGSTFDTYFISQTENTSSRFFMNPTGRSRRSVSQDKCMDLFNEITDQVLQSVVDTIRDRISNPVLNHPDYQTMLSVMRKHEWIIDQEAEADLITAEDREDAVRIMILLLAAVFQDYYSLTGIYRKVRTYLKKENRYGESRPSVLAVRENSTGRISPVSSLRTNQTYVRRGDLLERVEKKLDRLEEMGEKRFLLLYGAAGNGKSELARAYAGETKGTRYRKEFWLTCPHGEEQLTLDSLCRNAVYGQVYEDLFSQLASASSEVLLVIDNLNVEAVGFINELYYHTGEATVIITSRLSRLSGFDERNALLVYSDRQDQFCLEVFRKNYEKKRFAGSRMMTEEELVTASEICRRVYFNPLFISMIACFLREHADRITIKQFLEKLGNGILEAFPKYSQLDFRKDEREPVLLQPIEVLRVILREELNCIRLFGEEERQIMNLMVLFPAEPLSYALICEILGDNSGQLLMDSCFERLSGIGLLQRENNRLLIHPLVCELILSGIQLESGVPILYEEKERDAFYSHVLGNVFLFDQEKMRNCSHLAHTIYREIRNPSWSLQLVFTSLFDRYACGTLLSGTASHPEEPAVTAYFDTRLGRKFVMYPMNSRKMEVILDLSARKEFNRYFNHAYTSAQISDSSAEQDRSGEAVLLYFYQGIQEGEELITLDFSEGVDGHPIRKIPDVFLRRCSRQFSLILPEGLLEIGDWAFDACSRLRGPLRLPDSLERIGKGAFHGCSGVNGELHLPRRLKMIDDFAFCLCSHLEGSLILPDSLEELGEMAFCFCPELEGEVQCPPNLKRVGISAFYQCVKLTPSSQFLRIAGSGRREEEKTEAQLYLSPFAETIENEAFYGRTNLTGTLQLPASLKEIGDQAFYRCGRITGKLRFPSVLKKIGAGAFYGCAGLTGEVDLPDSCEIIGDGAFFGCTSLEGSLRLPGRIRQLAPAVFFMCSGLTEIRNMEELSALEVIGEGAFFRCTALKGGLYLPVKLAEIQDGAFDSCGALTGLYFSKSGNMKRLGNGAFNNCSGLTGTLHIPVSMELVGMGCFNGCGYHTCIVHNRDCELQYGFVNPEVRIIGFAGSTAEAYARMHGNPFTVLE